MTDEPKRLYVVLDKDGNIYGPFETASEAARWAKKKRSDLEQDPDGWDIVVVIPPDAGGGSTRC